MPRVGQKAKPKPKRCKELNGDLAGGGGGGLLKVGGA